MVILDSPFRSWQQLILRTLSFQNPFRPRNWMNISVLGKRQPGPDELN